MDQVIQLATHSVPIRRVLLLAFNMLVRPAGLFHPKVLFRVLLNVLRPIPRGPRVSTKQRQVLSQVEARD
jgi:hypothetical protein